MTYYIMFVTYVSQHIQLKGLIAIKHGIITIINHLEDVEINIHQINNDNAYLIVFEHCKILVLKHLQDADRDVNIIHNNGENAYKICS